jgi:cytochrome c5
MVMSGRHWVVVALAVLGISAGALAPGENGPASQRLKDGKAIYHFACARCHDTGEGDAPILGQREGWNQRSDLWEAVLFEHAEKGFMAMPAGGGDARLTEYDIDVAAEYMLQSTFAERPAD